MKKIYLSILSLAVLATANAQEATTLVSRTGGSTLQEATMINQLPTQKATVLWSDNCSDISTFTVTNTGTGTNANTGWEYSAAATIPTNGPFASTSVADGFFMVNSDGNNTGDNTNSIIHSELVTPTIDLSGNANVVLKFQQNFRWWHDTRTVSVSGDDGVTWTDYLISDDAAYDIGIYQGGQSTSGASGSTIQTVIDISAVAGSSSTVKIKFTYDDNDIWAWFWAIDDLEIIARPNDDIQVVSTFIVDQSNEGVEYGRTPIDQVGTNWEVGAQVYNFGLVDAANVAVSSVESNGAFSYTANLALIETDSTYTVSSVETPTLPIGTYVVDYTAVSDGEQSGGADFGDNVGQRTMEVTQWEYSVDGIGVYPAGGIVSAIGTASFTDASDNLVIVSKYNFKQATTIYSIKAMISSTTVAGGEVYGSIIDTSVFINGSTTALFTTPAHVVTAQDVTNGYVELVFDLNNQPSLAAGSYYAAVELISNSGSNNISILNDERVAQPNSASMIFLPTPDANGNQVFTNGNASAIRMIVQDPATIGLNENTLAGVSVYPNPSEGVVTVSNVNNTENTIVVYDMVGNVVYTTSANSSTTIDLSSNGTGVYMVKVSNENGSIVERVVIK